MKTAVVLHAAIAPEAPKDELDSLVEAEAVAKILESLGYRVEQVALALDMRGTIAHLRALAPEFVFNLVESLSGKGRLIHWATSLLDALGLRYTGNGTDAMFMTSNKLAAKKLMRLAGIPTPPFFTLADLQRGVAVPPQRYIVKAVWEHASVGITEESVLFADNPQVLLERVEKLRHRLGGDCFAEAFIEGREFNLAIIANGKEPQLLPPAEIRFDNFPADKLKIVDYRAKWEEESFEYKNTDRFFDFTSEDEPLLKKLRELALKCWNLFELRGYARVDFRVDKNGQPWILEVNANPCISPDGGFAAASLRSGISYKQIVERIVAAAH